LRVGLFVLGLLASAAYLPRAIDATLALRWASLALTLPLLLLFLGDRVAPLPKLAFAALVAVVLSALWGPDLATGLDEVAHVVVIFAAFWLGASLITLVPVWAGVSLGVGVSALVALAQVAIGLDWFAQAAPPAGLFGNRNFLAEAGMISLIALASMQPPTTAWRAPRWVLIGGALVAIALGGSKAVYGGLAVAAAFWIAPRRPKLALATFVALGVLAVFMVLVGSETATIRLEMWEEAITRATLFGNGLGAWASTYPIAEHAHSEPLQAIYEFGILAILPVAVLIRAMGGWSGEPEGYVVVALVAVSLFAFPLHLPLSAFVFALAAGHLDARRRRMVERALDRGADDGVGARRAAAQPRRGLPDGVEGRGDLPLASSPRVEGRADTAHRRAERAIGSR
jgi:hypothetical protein